MAEILLFHSALGLRPGVEAFADALRAAGHVVHVPDYFDGEVFTDLPAGVAKRDRLGIDEIARRAGEVAGRLPTGLVYAGFSLGAGPAQMLAQTRPGARGAILMHGALPSALFGSAWPREVPLAVHAKADDPWIDIEIAQTLADESDRGALHVYPGRGHLFADPDVPDHDPAAAAAMTDRVLDFLAGPADG